MKKLAAALGLLSVTLSTVVEDRKALGGRKSIGQTLGLMVLVSTVHSCASETDESNQFTITGTTMAPYVIDGEPSGNPSATSQSEIRVVVTRDVVNARIENEAEEIGAGEFQHEKVISEGVVEGPTSIRISVDADREETSILDGAI